jgi:diamine N-acetyltransferase
MKQNPTTTPLKILPCGVKDAKELSDIAIRAYKDYYIYLWWDDGDWYINQSFAQAVFERQLTDYKQLFFLLNELEDPIGFLKLNVDRSLEGYHQHSSIELERIYLIKAATGKGYGRQAVEFCFDYAKELKKEIIWLKAMDSSDAVAFYEKLGFEVCGTFRLGFPQMKPEFRGMVIMLKRL